MAINSKITKGLVFNFLICGAVLVLVTLMVYLSSFTNERTERHTIMSVDKVEKTSGNSNGYINTDVYYIVATDRGVYHIETSGLNAHPECLAIKKDSVYLLTTRGINIPIIGAYASIVGYQKVEQWRMRVR